MSLDWYPFFVVAYRRDTYHLSLAEDGAYRRLIDEYMMTREPLPNDDGALARILGIPKTEWEALAPRVRPFFRARNDRLFHKRCDEELRAQEMRTARNSERGKKAARAKRSKNSDLATTSSLAPSALCGVDVAHPPPERSIDKPPAAARASGGQLSEAAFDLLERARALLGWDAEDPRLMGNVATVQAWLNGGWDPKVCLTVIARCAGKKINGFRYFEGAIADAHAEISKPLPQGTAEATHAAHQQPRGGSYGAAKDAGRAAHLKLKASIAADKQREGGGGQVVELVPAARRHGS